jgi:uncharacterized membrane protein
MKTLRNKQFLALTLSAGLPAGLVFFRMAYTGSIIYGFLVWNLFLAWLPLLFAWFTCMIAPRSRVPALMAAAAWLAFLPNAPYLITDIAHLHPIGDIPYFYDVVMFFSLALAGLALGFSSVAWMQTAVRERMGVWPARLFAAGVIAMASFGVYIGRFLRWNSWDILIHPGPLFWEVARVLHHPATHRAIWAHVALLTVVLLFAYGLMIILPLPNPPPSHGELQ